jgi:lycopene cyclase-like protein
MASYDVLILGGGPAGLALASEAAQCGLSTALLEAKLGQPWPRSYGTWAAGLSPIWDEAISSRFEAARVVLPDARPLRVLAPYVRFDTERLHSLLMKRASEAGATLLEGWFAGASHEHACTNASYLHGAGERSTLPARLIVDARGREPQRASENDHAAPLAFQTAFGGWFEVSQHGLPEGELTLMDYRPAGEAEDEGAPSFLYAIPEADGRLFAQETVLASARPVPMALLERRLHARLSRLGIRGASQRGEERCVIALGGRLPDAASPFLPFGARAAFVQPATGYSLARSLSVAKDAAVAIAGGLSERGAPGARRALQLGHEAIWPHSAKQAYNLHRLGLACMLGFRRSELGSFLRAFFELPPHALTAFMDGTLAGRGVARAMWSVFCQLPMGLRLSLLRSSSGSLPLLHAALTGGSV